MLAKFTTGAGIQVYLIDHMPIYLVELRTSVGLGASFTCSGHFCTNASFLSSAMTCSFWPPNRRSYSEVTSHYALMTGVYLPSCSCVGTIILHKIVACHEE